MWKHEDQHRSVNTCVPRPSVDPERLCFGVQDAKMKVVLGLVTLPQRGLG
jgi:hypothetical protein